MYLLGSAAQGQFEVVVFFVFFPRSFQFLSFLLLVHNLADHFAQCTAHTVPGALERMHILDIHLIVPLLHPATRDGPPTQCTHARLYAKFASPLFRQHRQRGKQQWQVMQVAQGGQGPQRAAGAVKPDSWVMMTVHILRLFYQPRQNLPCDRPLPAGLALGELALEAGWRRHGGVVEAGSSGQVNTATVQSTRAH